MSEKTRASSKFLERYLNGEADVQSFLAQCDQAIEQRLPITVAGKIVVSDEEAPNAFGNILANDALQIVWRAEPAFAPLHIDDRAEGALVGAAASEIDTGERARRTAHVLLRQDRSPTLLLLADRGPQTKPS